MMATIAFRPAVQPPYHPAMKMGGRIKLRLSELAWQQTDLLRRVPDLEPATLSALIQRDSASSIWSDQIARALGVTHAWLATGAEPKLAAAQALGVLSRAEVGVPAVRSPESVSLGRQDPAAVKLLGAASSPAPVTLGLRLSLELRGLPVLLAARFDSVTQAGTAIDPAPIGAVQYPSSDAAAYAIQCLDDGLAPRCEHGEFLIVSPGSAVRPGDPAVLQMADGQRMVGILLYERAGRLHMARLNDRATALATVTASDIVTIHRIVGIAATDLFAPR
jgi:phage repressor protein C with HTH and peptisase S24 domain